MTAEEIFIKLRDELTAENESSSSPERIFIKSEGQTICTLGMNRSHEIIFVEFKPAPKDLATIEREGFVHPHPVEMLHDAGWRQAQLTSWEEAEKLLEIIQRSYKRKKSRLEVEAPRRRGRKAAALRPPLAKKEKPAKVKPKPAAKKKAAAKPQTQPTAKTKAKGKPKAKPRPKIKAKAKRAGKTARGKKR